MDMYTDNAKRRVSIFEDTMDMCWDNKNLSDSIDDTIEKTVLYKPNSCHIKRKADNSSAGVVTVTMERTLESAKRLYEQYPDCRIGVHNFASATNPGGGVKTGSNAQEECICRCSTLYQCIDTDDMSDDFYDMHRKRKDLRYTDTCIYSPDVVVFKSDTAFPELMPESEWFKVDVLTCAAPNLRKMPRNKMNQGSASQLKLSDNELLEIHKKRGIQLLNIAVENKIDVLVLGAFGCGAFSNNPRIVAQAYKEILSEYMGYFKAVNFAVYCPPNDKTNYKTFSSILKKE